MKSILHISAHFGGGVGTILANVIYELSKLEKYSQRLVLMEHINEKGRACCIRSNISFQENVNPSDSSLHKAVSESDIVIVHFWNHPLTYKFLHSFSDKTARMVFWCHTNGHNAPQSFPESILLYPNKLIFSTDYSYFAPTIQKQSEEFKESRTTTIFDSAGTNGYEKLVHRETNYCTVGYIGTVNYSKIHKDFVSISKGIDIRNIRFIVCGEDENNRIEQDVKDKKIDHLFDFKGQISDITPILEELDIFAYPLHAEHYGTGEQVLIEAMSAGIPQVVFNNGAESFVVQNGITGFVTDSIEDYQAAVTELSQNKELHAKMSKASREYAIQNYSIEHIIALWEQNITQLLTEEKKTCLFNSLEPIISDADIFTTSLGNSKAADLYKEALRLYPQKVPDDLLNEIRNLPPMFHSKTKGSIAHYSRFLNDDRLRYLNELTNSYQHTETP